MLRVLALSCAVVTASACQGLGCSLTGEMLYRALPDGDITLRLNISEDQTWAVGSVEVAAGLIGEDGREATEPVNASLEFSARGRREALITWLGASGTNWSGLLVGSDPNHIWLSGTDGLMAELTRTKLEREEEEAATTTANQSARAASTSLTTVEPIRGLSSAELDIGTLHRFRSLTESDSCLSASLDDPTPQFGACGHEDALWEVGKGRSPLLRSLKHHATGLCLQRRCYSDKPAPLRLGKCGECGTARWKLEGGSLASQAVVGSNLYCVGHEPPSPPPKTLSASAGEEGEEKAKAKDGAAEGNATLANMTSAASPDERATADETAAAAAIDADASGTNKSLIAWSTVCDRALADQIVGEAARMTLSLPAYSADTLLDDWLASVSVAQRSEVKALRAALGDTRTSLSALRQTMTAEAAKSSEENAVLSSRVNALSASLAAKTEEAEKTADSLANTQKQLKTAGSARAEALASERKWKSELADVTERANLLEESATAANAEMDKAVRRASAAEVSAKQLNTSLRTARDSEQRAAETAASAEAERKRLAAEVAALASRAEVRQGELNAANGRTAACEARIKEEWSSQQACEASAKSAAACESKYAALKRRSDESVKEADAARAAAAGKNESDAAAAECAAARREATEEVGRLEAARAKLRSELSAAQTSAQAALTKEGTATEAARASREQHSACAKEATKTARRLGEVEVKLDAATTSAQACTSELSKYQTYLGPPSAGEAGRSFSEVPTNGAVRLAKAVWFLLRTDWRALAARVRNAYMSGVKGVNGAGLAAPPGLETVPINARPAVYICALLMATQFVVWLQLRTARQRMAKDRELLLRAQERLQTMQRMLEAMDKESAKAALAALDLGAADGIGADGIGAMDLEKPKKNGKPK